MRTTERRGYFPPDHARLLWLGTSLLLVASCGIGAAHVPSTVVEPIPPAR